MCSNCNNSNSENNCRLAVTVDDNFGNCTFPERFFDVMVSSRDGSMTLTGRVAGGSSAVFSVPCDKEYAVTVTGSVHTSPRAQTKRVHCCCGQTSGVTFIFMTFEPEEHHQKFCPPCPAPCLPPCPPEPPCPKPCPPEHPCPAPCHPGHPDPAPCPPEHPAPAPCHPGHPDPTPCHPGYPAPTPCPPEHPHPKPCPPGPLCPQPCPPGQFCPMPCPPGQPCPPNHHPQPHPHLQHPVQSGQIENLCNIINEMISEE
ncbi:MAG: hypothetical protein HDT24_02445 [Ruminococcus sp.]|nr:hypothetical protein [Ruminococcus sp.]